MDFAHLHLHTEYSRDGVNSVARYAQVAYELGQPAIAVTDHGHLFSLSEGADLPVKYIPGCEVYVQDEMETKRHGSSHLTLLALDNQALRALIRVLDYAYTEGFYYVPRVSLEQLDYLSQFEGIVCFSGCISGYCAKPYLLGEEKASLARIKRLQRMFGERFYLELMVSPVKEQKLWNRYLVSLGFHPRRYIATCDVHYATRQDYYAHVVVVGGRAHETEPRFDAALSLYMQDGASVYRGLRRLGVPRNVAREAVANTVRVSEQASMKVERNGWRVLSVPFPDRHLEIAVREALKKGRHTYEYWQRAEEELEVIRAKGFAPFFLLVRDLVQYARSKGYFVNNRGSAVGSLVLYLLGVTSLDPVAHGIPYWRFISKVRNQPPDIDLDFERRSRKDVVDYLRYRCGDEFVAPLSNVGRYRIQLLRNDIKRAASRGWLPVSLEEVDAYFDSGTARSQKKDRLLSSIVDSLNGRARFISVHAGGYVISSRPLYEVTHKYKTRNQLVVALDKYMAENLELMKLDMLTVDTLDVLRDAVGDRVDPFKLEPTDKRVYSWMNHHLNDLCGVFQLGTRVGMEAVRKVRPSDFTELMNTISVIRPGSSGLESYAQAKKAPTEWPKQVGRVLKDTHGELIYQEQQMQLLYLAGFRDEEVERIIKLNKKASNLREHADEYRQFRRKWMESDIGLSKSQKEQLWSALTAYGFNKAHAAGYAYLTYITLWAKCNHYLDYMVALLNHERNQERQREIISEMNRMGYRFLYPHVNHSLYHHRVEDGGIRLGLSSIKFVGKKAAEIIVKHAPYDREKWEKLCRKKKGILNRRVVQVLAESGALEGLV